MSNDCRFSKAAEFGWSQGYVFSLSGVLTPCHFFTTCGEEWGLISHLLKAGHTSFTGVNTILEWVLLSSSSSQKTLIVTL